MKTALPLLLLPLLLAVCACSPASHASATAPEPGGPVAVARGVVEAQGGLARIMAPRDGVIAQVLAEEGDEVTAGQVLARMEDRQARLQLASAQADLADRGAQADIAAAKATAAEREARRQAALAAADAGTRQEADLAATAAVVARGEQRQAAAALEAARARAGLERYEIEVRTLKAQTAGRVVRRAAVAGGYAAAAAPLFTIEPNGARVVRAELDEAFADRVRRGATVTVSREFQTGQTWRAQVIRMSDVLTGSSLTEDAGARADTRVITVMIALPPDCDLRLGQRVLVRFSP